eukprot:COSAG01_NODE_8424_length_2788_cov_1.386017_5_plen_114_part_01
MLHTQCWRTIKHSSGVVTASPPPDNPGAPMVIARITEMRCQSVTAKGCLQDDIGPSDIKRCRPVIQFQGCGELAETSRANDLSVAVAVCNGSTRLRAAADQCVQLRRLLAAVKC